MVDRSHPRLSLQRQCELLSLSRSSYYYPVRRNEICIEFDYFLTRRIDQLYLARPYYGSRRMTGTLKREGYEVNRKRIQRLMREMGVQAIYPRKKLSCGNPEHRIYPYLLRGVKIQRVNHVWSTDITYIPMRQGFLYLVAIMDWYSRYVLSWELSQTLEKYFCISALERALYLGQPEIFNSDQGSQFTSPTFLQPLLDRGIAISMDGRGRVFDNIFIERLWRSVKHEEVYLKDYQSMIEAEEELGRYFEFYNNDRLHQSLGYRSPQEIFSGREEGLK
jgi:putative transposase